jgi:hypothetical protein
MTSDPNPPPPGSGGLQFDRAESSRPKGEAACAACKKALVDQFYVAGAAKICSVCREALQKVLTGGSASGRVLKAALLGLLAALVGGGLWALVIYATNYMIAFVAIGLGYLVGIAVRKGSGGRGGRGYQVLGLSLAYFGVATAYMGLVVADMGKSKSPRTVERTAEKPGSKAPEKLPEPKGSGEVKPAPGGCLGAFGMLALLYAGMPILVGKEDPFTFLFLGFAMWEAWKLNAGLKIRVTGPFRLDVGPAPGTTPDA